MPRTELEWVKTGAAILVFAAATATFADPDLWGHLRFGRDILRTHTLPSIDPYSFTQDKPWINHEWLSELQMALAYEAGGIPGLALLKGALVFGSAALVWLALRETSFVARLVFLGVLVLGTGSVIPTLRPQLWSLLFITVLSRVLVSPDRRIDAILPPLFLVWANVHGGWVVGLGVLATWVTVGLLADRRFVVHWLAVLAASTAATLVTPYGLSLWRFLWETVGISRPITEWQPLFSMPAMNWLPVVGVAVVALWLIPSARHRRSQTAAVLAVLAYGSFHVSRIGPLFVASAIVLMAPLIAARWPESPMPEAHGATRAAIVLVFIAVTGSVWVAARTLACIPVRGSWVAPRDAVSFLTNQHGRLVTLFDWGEYAIWHLGPALRVSMDGRRETIYSDARVKEHDAIVAGEPAGLDALSTWNPEYVWLPARSASTKIWLAARGYRIALDTPESFVAVRGDLPPLTPSLAAQSGARCFPD
jgi:hypothetical protein